MKNGYTLRSQISSQHKQQQKKKVAFSDQYLLLNVSLESLAVRKMFRRILEWINKWQVREEKIYSVLCVYYAHQYVLDKIVCEAN